MRKFIVIDGIDYVGKTTVANLLAKTIGGIYIYTPPKGLKRVRQYFNQADVTAKYLFYLSALMISSHEIKQALKTTHVIVDRYLATTICYHEVDGVNVEIVNWRMLPLVKPDYQFCLTISNRQEWLRRISERDGELARQKAKQEYQRFQRIAERMKNFTENQGGIIVDTYQLSPSQVAEKIFGIIRGE